MKVITRARRVQTICSNYRMEWRRSQLSLVPVNAPAADSMPLGPTQRMHEQQSTWQWRRPRGRHSWRIAVSVCCRLMWLVGRDRQCTTVPVHGAPWTSPGTTWTGRAEGREASEGDPAARAWCGRASLRRQVIALPCSAQTAAGQVETVEPQPAGSYSSQLWRWRNCWLRSVHLAEIIKQ